MNHKDRMICEKIRDYCAELKRTHESFNDDKALFYNDSDGFIYRNAVAMPILQIGELAKNLSEGFERECPGVAWKNLMRMRDVLAHHYVKLDKDILWETSHDESEHMAEEIDALFAKESKTDSPN